MINGEPLAVLKSGNDDGLKHPIVETTFDTSSHDVSEENKVAVVAETPPRHLSYFETLIHLLRTIIGGGVFALPSGFKNGGLLFASLGIPLMAAAMTNCMIILVKCSVVVRERTGSPFMDYAEVAEAVFKTGPKKLARFSKISKMLVNVFLCISQIGVGCVCILFTSTNLQQLVQHYLSDLELDVRVWMVIVAVPMIFLSWIRQLKYLAPVSLLGNISLGISFIIIFYYTFQDLPPLSSVPLVAPIEQIPLYFGTALFALTGICMVLPLQQDMGKPSQLRGWTGVLNVGMALVTILLTALGFFGYLRYGEDIEPSITLNLPADDVLAQTVKLMITLTVICSHPIQIYIPIILIWPSLSSRFRSGRSKLMTEYIFRTCMVLLTLVLAVAIPKLDLFISLVGAFSSTFLSLTFPPVLELITFWPRVSKWVLIKNIALILLGVVGAVTGTYASIVAIILAFANGDQP